MAHSKVDRCIQVMETMAFSQDLDLYINIEKERDVYFIRFTAGQVAVRMTLDGFGRSPKMAVEALGEELIKRLK